MPIEKSTMIEYRLETTIEQDGEREIFLFEGRGQIISLGEWLYLRYEEENTEVKVTIKLSRKGKMTIIRREGETLLSRMSFETGEPGNAMMPTPAGRMELETVTQHMFQDYKEQPFSGTVEVAYTLSSADQILGKYGISLQFTT